jgi:hypothetical protein
VTPTDPVTLGAVAAAVTLAAMLATWHPASRAAGVAPETLRIDTRGPACREQRGDNRDADNAGAGDDEGEAVGTGHAERDSDEREAQGIGDDEAPSTRARSAARAAPAAHRRIFRPCGIPRNREAVSPRRTLTTRPFVCLRSRV